MVIEKILGEDETLPRFSGIHGTTGYEWMNVISQVLVDGDGLDPLNEVWRQVSNRSPNLVPVVREAKRRVLETLLTSDSLSSSSKSSMVAVVQYSVRDRRLSASTADSSRLHSLSLAGTLRRQSPVPGSGSARTLR